jgi:hypothetical protein
MLKLSDKKNVIFEEYRGANLVFFTKHLQSLAALSGREALMPSLSSVQMFLQSLRQDFPQRPP